MKKLLARYLTDGSVRAIWSDRFASRHHGKPVRASRIEVVSDGTFDGYFFTTIILAAVTGDGAHDLSLWPPLPSYEESVQREVCWLERNYVCHTSVTE